MSQEPELIRSIIESVLISARPVKMDSETEKQFVERTCVWEKICREAPCSTNSHKNGDGNGR